MREIRGEPPGKDGNGAGGLAVRFPGCGMTGCGFAGGDLLQLVHDEVVVAFGG